MNMICQSCFNGEYEYVEPSRPDFQNRKMKCSTCGEETTLSHMHEMARHKARKEQEQRFSESTYHLGNLLESLPDHEFLSLLNSDRCDSNFKKFIDELQTLPLDRLIGQLKNFLDDKRTHAVLEPFLKAGLRKIEGSK